MTTCNHCGASVDPTAAECATCGNRVELGRLADILGRVCRACDTLNAPGGRTCIACGEPLSASATPAPTTPVAQAAPAVLPEPEPATGLGFESVDVEPLPTPLPLLTPLPLPPLSPTPPVRAGQAVLVVDRGVDHEGKLLSLEGQETGVGRTRGVLRFGGDDCLDPLHATVLRRGDALLVRDEGSSSGTYLRLRADPFPLRPGDVFAMGDQLLRFRGLLPPPPPTASDGTRRAGSPRPAGDTLVLESLVMGGAPGQVWLRPGPAVTVGRAGCSLTLEGDPFLSQSHAEVRVADDGGALLRDLGSSNGTFVRLAPHAEQEIGDGDVLRVGREVLRVVLPPT